MENEYKGALESRRDFKKTPEDQYRYWLQEITSSEQRLRTFRNLGTKTVKKFLGGTKATRDTASPDARGSNFRLNLFHSNVTTLQSMLYGNLPKVEVSRRHEDPADDVGRVAAMILERLLNNDVQDNGKEYNSVLRACLQDRLLPGLGVAKLRYAEPQGAKLEDAPVEYYHWRDVSWGWGRSFSDLPWIAFRTFLKKDQIEKRFGKDAAEYVQLKGEAVVSNAKEEVKEVDEDSPWRKGEIWEIWDREARKVHWLSPGYDELLDTRDDPLGLSGFYPCPPFLLANQTTSLYIPTSDYSLAQDLYNEVDILQTRISIITEAVKVVGVYDRNAEGLSRMFKEGTDNDLIPVDNWAMFAEKGGLEGQIDWVPIGEISETLLRLREMRDEAVGLLQQVTGMSDIMRGELGGQYEGVGQSELKVKFGSVRVQALQDEFAAFASDLLQLKAEIIGRHFEPESIARYANVDETFDVELVPAAVQLIKQPEAARMRVEIRPESVAMVDYAQLKQERTDYITAVSTFLQSSGPILEMEPTSKPFLLELLKWGLAGFKGAKSIEGVLDKAIEQSHKADKEGGEEQPDPEQIKQQGMQQLEQMKHQHSMQLLQAKTQSDIAIRKADFEADNATAMAAAQAEIQQTIGELHSELAQIQAKMAADIKTEQAATQANIAQTAASTGMEMMKNEHEASLDIGTVIAETEAKLVELREQAAAEVEKAEITAESQIKVEKAKPKPTAGGGSAKD